jgi:hypothetical protein
VLVVMLGELIQPLPRPVVAVDNPGLDHTSAMARLAVARSRRRTAVSRCAAADSAVLADLWRRGLAAGSFGRYGQDPRALR